jgi:Protein of unknown function (DUF3224)
MTTANGTFELASWNEQTYEELAGGRKLTRAEVSQTFEGDITGNGAVQWLMVYRPDGSARFVGLQRIEGAIRGVDGTFVLETFGDFDGRLATWQATVVPGSASGDLEGLTGEGNFGAPHGPKASFEMEYHLG